MQTITEPKREIPVIKNTEILVVGGGPAGLVAALAAGRLGVKTLLIERYGFLGGMATAGLVCAFSTFNNRKEQIIKGIPIEIIERLHRLKALRGDPTTDQWLFFDPETLKYVAMNMADESGVGLLLHCFVCNVYVENNIIKGVVTESKSGRQAILAQVVVDASGDGDVAAYAGVPYQKGRESDGLMLPMSLMVRMANVDHKRHSIYSEKDPSSFGYHLPRLWKEGVKRGEITIPLDAFTGFFQGCEETCLIGSEYQILATRVIKVDATNVFDLTYAEMEGRKQVMQVVRFLRKRAPGFEKAYLSQTGPQIGVRETRHIKGEYTLTKDDVLQGRKFNDVIARGCYMIDLHNPKGPGFEFHSLPEGESYDIPYRCLVPKKIDNLLVAGRCISATHKAHGSIRVMSHCMAIGQAAGTAAALAVKGKIFPRKLNIQRLQTQLRKQGAYLG